jgi:hypothetical protein
MGLSGFLTGNQRDAMRNRLTAVAEYRRKLLHAVSIAAKELLAAETRR